MSDVTSVPNYTPPLKDSCSILKYKGEKLVSGLP